MKLVVAFIQPFMAQQVIQALHALPGVSGGSFTDVRGFGRGRDDVAEPEVLYGAAKRVRVEVAVRDEVAGEVVNAIRQAAHTGNRGDGKILVSDLAGALRISTGEEGDAAI